MLQGNFKSNPAAAALKDDHADFCCVARDWDGICTMRITHTGYNTYTGIHIQDILHIQDIIHIQGITRYITHTEVRWDGMHCGDCTENKVYEQM